MSYPREWQASTDPSIASGTATFMVEGVQYTLHLESFQAFLDVSVMLDASFKQGKAFAAKAMSTHIQRALEDAERQHDLT